MRLDVPGWHREVLDCSQNVRRVDWWVFGGPAIIGRVGRRPTGGMHVDRVRSRHTTKSGEVRQYETPLLRRSFRKPDGRVGKQTLANLSALPEAAVDAVEAVLKGRTLIEAEAALAVTRSLPHGHVALVAAQAPRLGLARLVGPPCRER